MAFVFRREILAVFVAVLILTGMLCLQVPASKNSSADSVSGLKGTVWEVGDLDQDAVPFPFLGGHTSPVFPALTHWSGSSSPLSSPSTASAQRSLRLRC